MKNNSEAFIGLDVSKSRYAVAVADSGRAGEVRYYGEIESVGEAVRRLAGKLAKRYERLHFCYEAGPTGYGLYRELTALGHACDVVAPSLIPLKPGDRTKTNRRDAVNLAKLLRAGELTSVWVPDEAHEAIRDLVRTREAACRALRALRQQVTSFLLRHGRSYERKAWGRTHARWLAAQSFAHAAQVIAFHDMVAAVRHAETRLANLETAIREFVPAWSLASVVEALQAMRGIDLISAVRFLAEVGDLTRFENPRQLMGYLGLVPSEASTGDSVKRGSITKAGNATARRTLVECAWAYRFSPRVGEKKLALTRQTPQVVQAIAWKAQLRLTQRFRKLTSRGKKSTVAVTAVARELSGFAWAIAKEVSSAPPHARAA